MRCVPSLALLLLAGCSCPKPLCTQWVQVEVTSRAWDLGTYRLVLDVGVEEIRCSFRVVDEGVSPHGLDVECNDGTVPEVWFQDTSASVPPDRLRIKRPVGAGPEVPTAATLQLTWEGQGTTVTLAEDVLLLDWETRPAPSGTCASGCFTAEVVAEVPPLEGT